MSERNCPEYPIGVIIIACARPYGSICKIYIVADEIILELWGHRYEDVLRHEIGHCNGWPQDQKAAR